MGVGPGVGGVGAGPGCGGVGLGAGGVGVGAGGVGTGFGGGNGFGVGCPGCHTWGVSIAAASVAPMTPRDGAKKTIAKRALRFMVTSRVRWVTGCRTRPDRSRDRDSLAPRDVKIGT